MSDLDKQLEELVARTTEFCGCDSGSNVALCVHDTEAMGEVERIALPLAAALLRARKALEDARTELGIEGSGYKVGNVYLYKLLDAARADAELEKLLR